MPHVLYLTSFIRAIFFPASFPVSFLYLHPLEDEATLNVMWNSVSSPGNCNLTYRVSWNHTAHDGDDKCTNSSTHNNFNITELNYFTTYEVCVHPWVEGMTAIKICEISSTVTNGKLSNCRE